MRKGPKTALIALLVIAVVIGAGVVFLGSRLDGIVAGLIEEHGSAATGTAVRVDGVSISLRDASAALAGLTVASPDGFDGNAIELGGFSATLDAGSLTDDTVVIREVTVDGAQLRLVQQGARINLREILDHLQGGGEPAAEDASAPARQIVIERFALTGARASVSLPDLDEDREFELPDIVLTDIGRAAGGVTAAEATRQILTPVIRRTLSSAAVRSLRESAEDKLEEAGNRLLDGLKDRQGDDEQGDSQ